jgi:methylenetetrahydrofolate reductase (NADPH)
MPQQQPRISFEYFPPRTAEGKATLLEKTTPALNALDPAFFSVTYGAGGTTRDSTLDVVSTLRAQDIDVAPHLSFGGDDENAVGALVDTYVERGIKRLVALRGDMPSGMGGSSQLVYANELVAFIRERTGDHFEIEVAAYPEIHPQARDYDSDIRFLKGKLDAGADSAITQYFFNVEAYFYFLDQCAAAGINKPIYAAFPVTAVRKFRAGSASGSRAMATTNRASANSGSRL